MEIREDDLRGERIAAFLREHLEDMHAVTPPGSVHALDLEGLRGPDVTFWVLWDGEVLLGCGALKEIGERAGEIKSMRTAAGHRGRGIASKLLLHIIGVARQRGYERLSLETGAMEAFAPARALYERFDFEYCGPFGAYAADPNSVFMTKSI